MYEEIRDSSGDIGRPSDRTSGYEEPVYVILLPERESGETDVNRHEIVASMSGYVKFE